MYNKIIKNIDELAGIISSLKTKGKKVVFGNGCFDLLHVGHIRYLKGAKERGDCLVIAVNSDSSVRRLKTRSKLIMSEDERLEILSAIECIDYLTLFSEPSVANLLLKLQPHIHAKGTDYTTDTVPERETVLSYGGEVAIVGDAKNHSSSEIKSMLGPKL